MGKKKILFLCTANAARSQMAEGWARHLKGDIFDVYSAGVIPLRVSSHAITVMHEVGIDIHKHHSKHVNDLLGIDFDYVVTVCDNAKEQCPIFPGKAKVVHKLFADPARTTGCQEEIYRQFRKIRDEIKEYIITLPESLEAEAQ